jgi:hypothetical protein
VEQVLVVALIGSGVIITVLLGGLTVLLALKMRRGRNWARMLLTMGGVLAVSSAVPSIFGFGAATGVGAFVMGGTSIVQAVAAIGAIVMMFRSDSREYFR